MRKTKEILRWKWVLGRSHREIARGLGVSLGGVSTAAQRAREAGIDWAEAERLSEPELEARLYPSAALSQRRRLPDFAEIHTERQRKGVTLELLHLEYLEENPGGYGYTQFCEHYRRWCNKRRISMRQVHRAGEKLFVDYSGKRPSIIDRLTGEARPVELFVAALGASNLIYAVATETQRSADFIECHTKALEYIGGVPEIVIPDQLKSAVTRACRYEPGLHRTYEEWALHYGTTVIPARPRKPRDKAKAEVAVQVAQRWILACLRKETFFSISALNARIAELLEVLNHRVMRSYGESRRQRFEKLDRPALKPLPPARFTHGDWKVARVNIDYHIELDGHYYSVPHALVRETVEVSYTARVVEIIYRGERVASHQRSHEKGRHTTVPGHMPKSHRAHLEWTPSRIIHWGQTVGPQTGALVQAILADRPHPEQGYRSCLGILRLAKRYGDARLEAACARAVQAGARSYRHVDSILKRGLDQLSEPDRPAPSPRPSHENLRGGTYYQQERRSDHAHGTDPREAPESEARGHGAGLGDPAEGP
jgi:transposase